jgi:hypothetical protein
LRLEEQNKIWDKLLRIFELGSNPSKGNLDDNNSEREIPGSKFPL